MLRRSRAGLNGVLGRAQAALDGCPESIARVVPHERCQGREHLAGIVRRLTADGAEGVVIRDPDAAYENGKSHGMLRCVTVQSDEAEVVGHKTRSLICRWRDVVFGLTVPDATLASVGESVTFNFRGLTDAGLPRFAAFVGVRDYE